MEDLRELTLQLLTPRLGDFSNLSDKLDAFSVEEMREIFTTLLPYSSFTQSSFSKRANIDCGNFSRWVRGKKRSPQSFFAVRDWLVSILARERWVNEPTRIETNQSLTLLQLLEKLSSREVKAVLVIDADNMAEVLSQQRLIEQAASFGAHFVAVLRKGGENNYIDSQLNYISLIHAKSFGKDSADIRCATTLSSLAALLQEVSFALVTKDIIAKEIVEDIGELALCVWIKSEEEFKQYLSTYIRSNLDYPVM